MTAPRETTTPRAAIALSERGLCLVSTLRADSTIQVSLVNSGLIEHPVTGAEVLAFVTYGPVKLRNLRERPTVTAGYQSGWQWATIEGTAELAGPDDPYDGIDADRLRRLLREIFTAAGGTHDDWDEYDRVMLENRRAAVLVTPTRVYSN